MFLLLQFENDRKNLKAAKGLWRVFSFCPDCGADVHLGGRITDSILRSSFCVTERPGINEGGMNIFCMFLFAAFLSSILNWPNDSLFFVKGKQGCMHHKTERNKA